jgi:hypothetical protein
MEKHPLENQFIRWIRDNMTKQLPTMGAKSQPTWLIPGALTSMESYRKAWNKRQTEFRDLLRSYKQHTRAMEMFLSQHAQLHSAEMAGSEPWSFEDWIWEDLSETQFRRIPHGDEHSIAWILWHIARIEDVTMNMLVAGEDQLFNQGGWAERLGANVRHTGNAMDTAAVKELSTAVNLTALREYRLAVGRRTQTIVSRIEPETLKAKVDPHRLERVKSEGVVVEAANAVIEYWRARDICGLLLMPPTRHAFIHLNEALRLKRRKS